MAKQAIKKGAGIQKKSLSAWKEKNGLAITGGNLSVSNIDKPMDWLIMPNAFQEAVRLPGFPIGYVSMIKGQSDTGKTTILNHALVSAQRQGFIPVIYDTENNMDWKYLIDMGFEASPIYANVEVEKFNEETGEVEIIEEEQIVGYDGDFIYFNNTILAEKFGSYDYSTGKETKKKRKDAVIEDVAASMKELMDAQDNGDIEAGLVFVWDSVGSIVSYKSYKSLTNNPMFDAAGISACFTNILNNKIPSTRKKSSPYVNTMIVINKTWKDMPSMPGGIPTTKCKGGESIYYASRLVFQIGGELTRGTKKLKAISKGATYRYGLETKIKVEKNHLPSPYNLTYEGTMICTPHGLVSKDELVQYQKDHINDMLKELNSILEEQDKVVNIEDVEFTETEENEE